MYFMNEVIEIEHSTYVAVAVAAVAVAVAAAAAVELEVGNTAAVGHIRHAREAVLEIADIAEVLPEFEHTMLIKA